MCLQCLLSSSSPVTVCRVVPIPQHWKEPVHRDPTRTKKGPRMSGVFDPYQLTRYGVVQELSHAIILRAPPNRAENVWYMMTSGREETGVVLVPADAGRGGAHQPDRGVQSCSRRMIPAPCRMQECDACHGRRVGGGGTLLPHLSQAPDRVIGRRTSYGMWVRAPLGLWDWSVVWR